MCRITMLHKGKAHFPGEEEQAGVRVHHSIQPFKGYELFLQFFYGIFSVTDLS